jgi:bifunctional non-homologous end joining protein LigD
MLSNRVVKENFSPQLATLTDVPPEGDQWVHEAKLDGYRTLAYKDGKSVRFITRNGNDWTATYAELASELQKFPVKSLVLDGEVVALNEDGVPDFNKLQNSVGKKRAKKNVGGLVFYAFDLLWLDGKDLRSMDLLARKKKLKALFSKKLPPHYLYSEHFGSEDPRALVKEMCELGLEGIVSKRKDSSYEGRRSPHWLKIKCSKTEEFIIIGYRIGTEHEIGSLLLGSYQAGKIKYEGKVGTGFSAKTKQMLWKKFKPLMTKTPIVDDELNYDNIVWLRPKLVAEVEFLKQTGEGLRHASFLRLRPDKDPDEVSPQEEINETKNSDSVVYPKTKITRQEVMNYYRKICKLMLPDLRHRPLNIYACHGGIQGRCYYLRRSDKEQIPHIKTARKPNGHYLMSLDNFKGIETLVNLGAVEFHIWGTRMEHLETPDRIIIDLDAGPSVSVKQIQDCALLLKDLLSELGLKTFLMTSGGKGYHLHVPISPLYSWDQIKSFSESLSKQLEDEYPHLYTSSVSPARRRGKIFIDYLRNSRGHTAIAPYSLRARDEATIAVPISWRELRQTTPDAFTIKDLPKLLKRKDPWAGILKIKQKIQLLDELE